MNRTGCSLAIALLVAGAGPPLPAAAGPRTPSPAPVETPGEPTLQAILERAGAYVVRYAESFRYVVAEELYRQWAVADGPINSRTLRSDMVFVRIPGPLPWTTFRDVYELDGRKIRGRDRRLEKLFAQGATREANAQAQEVLLESSRYNLGPSFRTINVPTLGMQFLLPGNQRRLAFERKKGTRSIAGFVGVEIAFRETASPTLVHDNWRNDVPARGRFWVEPMRGTVLRTEIEYDFEPERRARGEQHEAGFVETEFRHEPGLGLLVPDVMTEFYDLRSGRIETKARYSKFRRFEVTTGESVVFLDVEGQQQAPAARAGTDEPVPSALVGELPPEAAAAPPPPELPMIAAPLPPGALGPLVQKAADYVADYEQRFRDLVAAETCIRRGRAADGSMTSSSRRSLVVFAMIPGEVPWIVLREPAEGPAAGRLEQSFREAPGQATRAALAEEDAPDPQVQLARPRTPPTLALAVLRPENRDRYRFERRGARTIGGAATVEIAFTETGAPTQLVDVLGRALPSSGRLFVRESDGAVLRSELTVGIATKLEAVTEYASDPALGLLVPSRLRETISSGESPVASGWPAVSRGQAGQPALHAEDRLQPQSIELSTRFEQFRRLAVP